MKNRLYVKYRSEIAPALKKELGYENIMQIPKLEKIVINQCLSDAVQNAKILNTAAEEIAVIAGQK
ncbi:MAG: 50S ribosomal protein L5, partial [Bdellovibrionaceae bacterium]|nr:50S ribosomal protein L5 [Pseudobdellovibrionaceae bacterium]